MEVVTEEGEITIFFKILIENLAKFYIKFLKIYSAESRVHIGMRMQTQHAGLVMPIFNRFFDNQLSPL